MHTKSGSITTYLQKEPNLLQQRAPGVRIPICVRAIQRLFHRWSLPGRCRGECGIWKIQHLFSHTGHELFGSFLLLLAAVCILHMWFYYRRQTTHKKVWWDGIINFNSYCLCRNCTSKSQFLTESCAAAAATEAIIRLKSIFSNSLLFYI